MKCFLCCRHGDGKRSCAMIWSGVRRIAPEMPPRENPRAPRRRAGRPAMAPALDRYDIAILRELQRDARLSNAELASRIGCRPHPPGGVRWLEEQGFITGYRAEIDRRDRPGRAAFVRIDADRNTAEATPARGGDPPPARGDLLPLHLSGTGTFELQGWSPPTRRLLALRARRADGLPNVKDVHTSFRSAR